MGHIRLGSLPKTRPWRKVVELISSGADVAKVAEATVTASEKALNFVDKDVGFREAVQLLTHLGISGSKKDPLAYLSRVGVHVPDNATAVDFALAVKQALERKIKNSGRRCDFGDKAGNALVATLSEHFENRLGGLLTASGADVVSSLKGLQTAKGFGEFGRSYFNNLTLSCMNYFLSKTLGSHVGEGHQYTTLNQMDQFQSALATHCRESSRIVEGFCGEWFSKHRYMENGEISQKSIEGFGWFALEKMRKEFVVESGGGRSDGK